MPYKNPERKRQWEREHREQRNARRRKESSGEQNVTIVPKLVPDPNSAQEPKSIWPVVAQIVGLAFVIGIGLLAGWVGISAPVHPGSTNAPA